jgi:hypothetical protein
MDYGPAEQALMDLKRRAKLRELRKRYGDEYLFVGSQHPEAEEINREFSMRPVATHREKVDAIRDMGITDEARIEYALERTQGDLNAAAELLMGSG